MNTSREVLIIDDDSKNIFALTAVLRAKKYRCRSAMSAEEGFRMLAPGHNIGAVLMDMMMPGMDGYEAVTKMKQNPDWKGIPVIAITAQAMAGDREKCLEAGADGYISKPVDVTALVDLLTDLMD